MVKHNRLGQKYAAKKRNIKKMLKIEIVIKEKKNIKKKNNEWKCVFEHLVLITLIKYTKKSKSQLQSLMFLFKNNTLSTSCKS